jgi:hypothetical protein
MAGSAPTGDVEYSLVPRRLDYRSICVLRHGSRTRAVTYHCTPIAGDGYASLMVDMLVWDDAGRRNNVGLWGQFTGGAAACVSGDDRRVDWDAHAQRTHWSHQEHVRAHVDCDKPDRQHLRGCIPHVRNLPGHSGAALGHRVGERSSLVRVRRISSNWLHARFGRDLCGNDFRFVAVGHHDTNGAVPGRRPLHRVGDDQRDQVKALPFDVWSQTSRPKEKFEYPSLTDDVHLCLALGVATVISVAAVGAAVSARQTAQPRESRELVILLLANGRPVTNARVNCARVAFTTQTRRGPWYTALPRMGWRHSRRFHGAYDRARS